MKKFLCKKHGALFKKDTMEILVAKSEEKKVNNYCLQCFAVLVATRLDNLEEVKEKLHASA